MTIATEVVFLSFFADTTVTDATMKRINSAAPLILIICYIYYY